MFWTVSLVTVWFLELNCSDGLRTVMSLDSWCSAALVYDIM
jgi:hypothetical protein